MRPPMHDNPSIFPTLPPRREAVSDAQWHLGVDFQTDPGWRACWEYVLTHDLSLTEKAAFWTGANLGRRNQVPEASPLTDEPRYRCPRCERALPWTDGVVAEEGVSEADWYWCQVCGCETPLDECEEVPA